MNSSTDVWVLSFTHLTDKKHADKALHLLKRIASLVKPIMRKHGWKLPELAEFFPDQQNLLGLNVNMGQKILIRLRPAHAPDTFLPETDLIGTMLHELTHNVHGPHDEKFYKYLEGLKDEYYDLQRAGYSGEGFFSEGRKLGTSHNLPPHLARIKALEAAEKRRKSSQVQGSGGRLGGRNSNLTPREMAARAAEQRIRDEKACASGASAQREVEKAELQSSQTVKNFIDLTLDDDNLGPVYAGDSDDEVIIVKDVHPAPPKSTANAAAGTSRPRPVPGQQLSNTTTGSASSSVTSKVSTRNVSNPPVKSGKAAAKLPVLEWSCDTCTLLNQPQTTECEACGIRKPPDETEGWGCLVCGQTGIPHDFWTCTFCGQMKLRS
ncbi:WLM domain-containing protein [Panaeolus papilionaceus]|nr:WLM domain-containing protein [Panaeolus papilionaceus]